MSFIADKVVMDGLTYDDVLLIPAYSEVLPKTVDLSTKFTRHIDLKIPFVTAAMDTVTEAKMAIAIAREGGIGVIHKNMSIDEQARQVAIVKRAENGMIYDPVVIKRGSSVHDALDLMSEYKIGGIPVVDDDRRLVGIVTNRDLRFERDVNKRIDEVMTSENIVTTHQGTTLDDAAQILQEYKIEKLPVVDAQGRLVGLITYKDITKAKDKPMACKDDKGRLRVAAGVGVTDDTLERMQALINANADAIVIDECTHYANAESKRSKAIKAFIQDVKPSFVWGLTGTPGYDPLKAFAMSKLVNPKAVTCNTLYAWRDLTQYKYGTQAWQWKNRECAPHLIKQALSPAVLFKKDDLFDLPPVVYIARQVQPTTEQKRMMTVLRDSMVVVANSGEVVKAQQKSALASKLLQCACGCVYTDENELYEIDNPSRVDEIMDLIGEATGKTVIFSAFTGCINKLYRDLTARGVKVAVVEFAVHHLLDDGKVGNHAVVVQLACLAIHVHNPVVPVQVFALAVVVQI